MVKSKQVSQKEFAKFAGVRWNAMNDICGLSKIEELTAVQRTAHLCYLYMSEVYNGGHFQYFVNKHTYDHTEVVRSLETIGANEQKGILASALRAVVNNPVNWPQTTEEFIAGEAAANLTSYDIAFNNCERTIESCLEDYLDKHEEEFIEWAP